MKHAARKSVRLFCRFAVFSDHIVILRWDADEGENATQ